MGFMHLNIKIKEKFKLKTKLTKDKNLKISSIQVMQSLFSFQAPSKFLKSIHWLWTYINWRIHPAYHFWTIFVHGSNLCTFPAIRKDPLSLISIHAFRLSLTLFFVREKFLVRKINLHFLRVPAKTVASEN